MSKRIKGITIELGAETKGLDKALKGVNDSARSIQGELREVGRLLKFDPGNTELIAQKQKLLSDAVTVSSEKLETLKEAQRQVEEQFKNGEVGEEQYRAIQREVLKAEQNLDSLEKQLDQVNKTGSEAEKIEKAIADVNAESTKLQTELREVDKLLKMDPGNTELIAQKQKLLGEEVNNTKDKLELLKQAQAQAAEQFARGEIGEEQYRAISREVVQTEQSLDKLEKQLEEVNKTGSESEKIEKAISEINKESKDLQSELKEVDRLLKMDPGNTELIAQKQKLLGEEVNNTKEKLELLKQAQILATEQFERGEISEEQYRAISREVLETENNLNSLEDQLKNVNQTGSETEKVQKAIADIGEESEKLQEELKEVDRLLELDPGNTELVAQKQKLLGEEVNNTKEKLELLKQAQAQAAEQFERGEIGEEQYRKINRELVETEHSLKGLQDELEAVNNKWADSARKLEDFGNKATSMGKGMTTKVTGPIAAVGGAGVKMGIDLDNAIGKLSTIADLKVVPLDTLRKEILALSSETGIAASQITNDVYDAISAGQDTGNAVRFVAESAKLAKAGYAESADALDILTTTLNAYKMESTEAERVSDLLITTQNEGKVTVGELASSMGKIIPTAVATNTKIEQLTTGYAVMTKNGIAASETTTYMNSMLNELSKTGSATDIALREVAGKGFSELMGEGKNLTDVLALLDEHAKANGLTLKDLFSSSEAGKAALSLSAEGGKEFVEILDIMNDSAEATNIAMKIINDTAGEKLTKAFNKVKNATMEMAAVFVPVVTGMATVIGTVAGVIEKLPTPVKTVIAVLLAMIAAIGPLLVVIGQLALGISALAKIGGIAGIITKVSLAFTQFSGILGTIGAFITTTIIPAIVGLGAPFFIVAGAIAAVIAIGVALYKNWDAVKEKAGQLGEYLSGVWGGIKDVIGNAWNSIKETTSKAWDSVTMVVKFAWEAIKSVVMSSLAILEGVIGTGMEVVKYAWKIGWEYLKEILGPIWDSIKNTVTQKIDSIKDALAVPLERIRNAVVSAWTSVKDKTLEVWNSLKDFISPILDNIKTNITSKFESAKESVVSVSTNIRDAVFGKFSELKSKIQSIWTTIKDTISKPIEYARDIVSKSVDSIVTKVGGSFNSLVGRVSNIWEGIKKSISSPIEQARDRVGRAIESIKAFFNKLRLRFPQIEMPKLPRFRLEGKLSLNPPSVPRLNVDWFAKGGILTKPTIFGQNGGNLMGGGEAGKEAIIPIDRLKGWIFEWLDKGSDNKSGDKVVAELSKIAQVLNNQDGVTSNNDSHQSLQLLSNIHSAITNSNANQQQGQQAVFRIGDVEIARAMIGAFRQYEKQTGEQVLL